MGKTIKYTPAFTEKQKEAINRNTILGNSCRDGYYEEQRKKIEYRQYKHEALAAAKDFKYPVSVIEAIKRATTADQISVIMTRARKEKWKK